MMKWCAAKSAVASWCAERKEMARHFSLTADGGSRGNPGPAGYGTVITENGKIIAELYDFI